MPFGKNKKQIQRRFVTVNKINREEGEGIKIIKDKVTGVNYLVLREMTISGTSTCITPLIGADGKIVIDSVVDTEVK